MLIKRTIEAILQKYTKIFPVVAIVGPRQSGKTTIAQKTFSNHKYFSLENPDTLEAVRADPRGLLETDYGTKGIILDEFQNEPQILSYIQGIVDKNRRPGYFILTGSHNFLMNQAISQTLAGRIALLTLLPLSLEELESSALINNDINAALFYGGYPEVFARQVPPTTFYTQYNKTYVERDVQQLINVKKLSEFQRFMRLCAGRIGGLLNVSALADDCNVSVQTVNEWLSVLEASYIIFRLQPHFKNFSKRLIKSPKLYFYDTGLACWLLKIQNKEQVDTHYLRGQLVESLIISELCKGFHNKGQDPSIYFWRDSQRHEIDCLLDYGTTLIPVEIKSGKTIKSDFFKGIQYWSNLAGVDPSQGYVVYAGSETQARSTGTVIGWQSAADILK